MTLAAPWLWWLSGFAGCATYLFFQHRQRWLGIAALVLCGLLALWASQGTALRFDVPQQVHPAQSQSPHATISGKSSGG